MSIGIVVPFDDNVVLVADGMQLNISVEGEPVVSQDVHKIHFLGDRVGLISFGVSQVTEPTIDLLTRSWAASPVPPMLDGETILTLVNQALARVWAALSFDPSIDLSRPELVAGFAVGAITNQGPYVGIMLRTHGASIARVGSADRRARMITSYDTARAQDVYLRHERAESVCTNLGSGSAIEVQQALLRAAARAVREVGSYDRSVGGTIRYAILSPLPPFRTEGIYPG